MHDFLSTVVNGPQLKHWLTNSVMMENCWSGSPHRRKAVDRALSSVFTALTWLSPRYRSPGAFPDLRIHSRSGLLSGFVVTVAIALLLQKEVRAAFIS
jgi:hypothetical protein